MNLRTRRLGLTVASALVMIALAGCGTTQASPSTPPAHSSTSTSKKASHHAHKRHRLLRAHGTVTTVNASTLSIRTKIGKTLTFTLTSKTKYRMKKTASSLTAVKPGATVTVAARRSTTGPLTALVVRLL